MTKKRGTLIGVIADTHGLLRDWAVEQLKPCDFVIHAGDIGRPQVLADLRNLGRVVAVRFRYGWGRRRALRARFDRGTPPAGKNSKKISSPGPAGSCAAGPRSQRTPARAQTSPTDPYMGGPCIAGDARNPARPGAAW